MLLFKTIGSQNLINNGSFENATGVDCNGGFYSSTFPNPHILDYWYNFNSPDYFNTMCPNGPLPAQFGYSVPANMFGYSNAKHGNAYVGLAVLPVTGGNSEYIYQLLSNPLQASKIYCLRFFISRADRKEYALKNIGAYFSTSIPTMISGSYINSIPQIINQNGFISDTTQWLEIQGCYTALGGEQYITIGNFNGNANIDTLYVGTNNPIPSDPKYSYYYIDDITLYDQSTVGVKEFNYVKNINLFPNPNDGNMQLDYELSETAELLITDVSGGIINSKKLDEKQRNFIINLQALSAGVYFYSVKQKNVILKQDKFVIIK